MFCCPPHSSWTDRNLAEAAGHLGKVVEQPNQSQPNPGARADGTPGTKLTIMTIQQNYREVQLDSTPEIEVFHMLFERCHSKIGRDL